MQIRLPATAADRTLESAHRRFLHPMPHAAVLGCPVYDRGVSAGRVQDQHFLVFVRRGEHVIGTLAEESRRCTTFSQLCS
jgi:hypothetical protein